MVNTSTIMTTEGENSSSETTKVTDEFSSYSDASYTSRKKEVFTGDTLSSTTNELNYSGIDPLTNKYYGMSFARDGKIKNIYIDRTATEEDKTNSTLFNNPADNGTNYGISGIINSLFFNNPSLSGSFVTFANAECYAYSEFSNTDSSYLITSAFTDRYTDINYETSFKIDYQEKNIIGFKFIQDFKGKYASGNITV
jgi:hypothetical protein